MTKKDLKKLIAEVYEEEMSETKKKQTTKVAPKVVKKVEEPVGRITKSFVQGIEDREKSNKMRGDKTDAAAFDRIGKILRKHVGRTLEEGDIEQMLEEMSCEECYEEGAKPDFLDLDKDGNKTEPMKKAAGDAKNKKHHDKLKEIIQKAKNI